MNWSQLLKVLRYVKTVNLQLQRFNMLSYNKLQLFYTCLVLSCVVINYSVCLSVKRQLREGEFFEDFRLPFALKSGQIVLHNSEDKEFYGYIYVGSPPQPIQVMFDAGTPNTWLASTTTKEELDRHNLYDSSKSSTYRQNGSSMNFNWGDTKMTGFLSLDDMRIGDLKVKHQAFTELVTEDGGVLYYYKSDGVVGLGLPEVGGPMTLVDNLFEQGLISKRMASMWLSRGFQFTTLAGEVSFGEPDERFFNGDIGFTKALEGSGAWKINIEAMFTVFENETRSSLCQTGGCSATFDISENMYVTGPSKLIAELNQNLGAQLSMFGVWAVDCDLQELADFVINLGGKNFTLSPAQYTIRVEGLCATIFQDVPRDKDIVTDWVLSYPIFTSFYTVFDYDNKQVGFAELFF